jgi:hypothetical protein
LHGLRHAKEGTKNRTAQKVVNAPFAQSAEKRRRRKVLVAFGALPSIT